MKYTTLIAAVSASQVIPRRLNTNLGQFVESDAPVDMSNIGVRFVNINDDKNNEALFKLNQVERIGGHGFLVAGTDDPKNWTGGHTKVVPGLEEIKGFLTTLGTKEKPDVPSADSVETPEATDASPEATTAPE